MPSRRRCPHCRCLFIPNPRIKGRQKTCGKQQCRRELKRQSNKDWRSQHSDYFQGMYSHQKEVYGSRAAYKKQYRKQHPDYVRRNAAYVKKWRMRQRERAPAPVSHTSYDIQLSLWSQWSNVSISQVSHTSRDIYVTVCPQ